MRKKLFLAFTLALLLVLVFCCAASAESGSCGEQTTWTKDENGVVTISGKGPMADYYWNWHDSPFDQDETITAVVIEEGITHVGDWAFSDCVNLSSLTLPDGLKTIGAGAFSGTALTEVSVPASVTFVDGNAFYCDNLAAIWFWGAETALDRGVGAVHGVNGMVFYADPGSPAADYAEERRYPWMLLPDPERRCGDAVYWAVDGDTVYIDGEGSMWDYTHDSHSPFYGDQTIHAAEIRSGVTTVGAYSFFYCKSLESVHLPQGLIEIGDCAFVYCESLDSVIIPSGVERIGYSAFRTCVNLSSLLMEEGLTRIEDYAFEYCIALSVVSLPESLLFLGTKCFARTAVTEVYLPAALEYYCGSFAECDALEHFEVSSQNNTFMAVDGVLYSADEKILYAYPPARMGESYLVPEGVTGLGADAFATCRNLTEVVLPESIKYIDSEAFMECTGLTELQLPDGLTDIERYAFQTCNGLTSMEIPAGVTVIMDGTFAYCHALSSVLLSENLTKIGDFAFKASDLTSVVIPKAVTYIGHEAFWGCENLAEFTICGVDTELDENACEGCPDTMLVRGWAGSPAESFAEANGFTFEAFPGQPGGVCGDNVSWTFDAITGTITISGTGPMWDSAYHADFYKWYDFHDLITAVVIESGVTRIGREAFFGCDNLKSVLLPDGLTNIGGYAFEDCPNLKSITFPDSIVSIEVGAFAASGLTELALPASVQEIGQLAFGYCIDLKRIEVSKDNSFFCSVDGVLFNKDMSVLWAFPAGHASHSYVIPESVTVIYGCAFSGCAGLINVELPDGLTEIRNAAFADCNKLKELVFPKGLRTIKELSFDDCYGLEKIVFRGSQPTINLFPFSGCTLTAYYPAGDPSWDYVGDIGGTITWVSYDAGPDFILPAALTTLEAEAFAGVAARGVLIPETVTSIEGNPFAGSQVTTIYGYPGSAAQTFAAAKGYNFVAITDALLAAFRG